MPITVSDLIHSSARLIGAIAAGELLESTELDDAFLALNQMISSWNTEGLSLAGRMRQAVSVGSTTNAYPLPTRSVKIESASVSTAGIDCPLEIVDSVGWEAITEKGALAIITKKLYCDYAFPSSTVYIWPTPRSFGQLELWTFQPITPFVSLSSFISLPDGYEAAVRFNLAVALAPEYGRTVDPVVAANAQEYKKSLVQLNASNHARSQAQSPVQAAQAVQQGTSA